MAPRLAQDADDAARVGVDHDTQVTAAPILAGDAPAIVGPDDPIDVEDAVGPRDHDRFALADLVAVAMAEAVMVAVVPAAAVAVTAVVVAAAPMIVPIAAPMIVAIAVAERADLHVDE